MWNVEYWLFVKHFRRNQKNPHTVSNIFSSPSSKLVIKPKCCIHIKQSRHNIFWDEEFKYFCCKFYMIEYIYEVIRYLHKTHHLPTKVFSYLEGQFYPLNEISAHICQGRGSRRAPAPAPPSPSSSRPAPRCTLCSPEHFIFFTEFFVFNEIIAFANREDIQNLGKPYPLKIFFTYWSLIFLSVFVHLGGDAQLVVERGGVGVDTSGDDTPWLADRGAQRISFKLYQLQCNHLLFHERGK